MVVDHCKLCIVQKRQDCPALQAHVKIPRKTLCSAVQRTEKEKADEILKLA